MAVEDVGNSIRMLRSISLLNQKTDCFHVLVIATSRGGAFLSEAILGILLSTDLLMRNNRGEMLLCVRENRPTSQSSSHSMLIEVISMKA